MLKRKTWRVVAEVCALTMAALWAAPLPAQTPESKEKPPMYTYVSFWALPRPQWAAMEKSNAADQKILDKALAAGSIVGYGYDVNLVHQADGFTHDDWWSATSLAGVLDILDQFYKAGTPASPVLASATKHWDSIFVSRYYNWKSGPYKGAYTRVSTYKFKESAPDEGLNMLAQNLIVPLLEKQLAAGAILEYEIDTLAIHTQAPGTFFVVFIAPTPEGLDAVQAAIRDAAKANPLGLEAFDAMTDAAGHRDELDKSEGIYK